MLGTVYRVQHKKTGEGCYVSRHGKTQVKDILDGHNFANKHPNTRNDPGISRNMETDEYCGFIDLRQLQSWFCEYELEILRGND